MTRRSKAGSTKPRRRKAPAARRRRGVETIRDVTSSASKEELRFALLRRKLSEARRHHRRAEEALRESEYKLRQIIESAVPGMLWVTGPDGEVTRVNQRTLDFTGARSVEDLLNLGWQKFLHPEDFPKTANAFFHAIQTGEPYENLQRVRRVDGEYRWHHVRAEPLRDREGRIIEWYGLSVDIDEGKKVEERLRRSEAYLPEAQRLTQTATVAYNATEILYFSDEAFRLFGFDPLQGLPSREAVWRRIHPGDVDTVNEKVEHALRERRSFQNEFRLRLTDGTVKHVDADILPLFSATGELVEIIATAVDVTERKRAEDTLRRGEAWLAQAQRLSHTGTWVLDGTTRRFLFWSDESYRIWGFDPQQGLPSRDDMWGRIHPDDGERVWGEVQEALREKRDFRAEFRILLPDGTVKCLEANTHHEFSPLGTLLEVICTNVDVTERKHAEQALRESERKHRQLIESVPCHFWSVNPNGEPTYVNQRLLDYFGIRFEDQKRDMTVLHPDDVAETERALNHAFQTGESFQRVHRLRRADGEYRWHRVRAEPLRDHEGHIIQWYGFSFDIDEGKKAQDQLRRSEAYLAEAQHLSHTGSFGWTPSTGDFHWSDETFRILEYDSSVKPTMERVVQRVHPDDLAIVRQVIDEASRGDKVDIVHRLLIPDGSVKFLHVLGYALKDAAGNLEIVGAVMDVTERKRAEQALRESEAKFRAAIDGIAGLVAIMGPSGELEAANRPIVEYFGRTVEDMGHP